jgi:carbonic anhydrase
MITALEALDRLRDGNRRFVADTPEAGERNNHAHRLSLAAGQAPFATILGCSDSRVPAELIFDLGFGDLFVIRVAGNIVASSQIGSIEFAAARFSTKLVVVIGHSQCGAITATMEELTGAASSQSRNLRFIVDRVRPSVEAVLAQGDHDADAVIAASVRANVSASCAQLRHGSELLERMIEEQGLMVVGAEYSLESGVVTFFDGVAS